MGELGDGELAVAAGYLYREGSVRRGTKRTREAGKRDISTLWRKAVCHPLVDVVVRVWCVGHNQERDGKGGERQVKHAP